MLGLRLFIRACGVDIARVEMLVPVVGGNVIQVPNDGTVDVG